MSTRRIHPEDTTRSEPAAVTCPQCSATLRAGYHKADEKPYVLFCPTCAEVQHLTPIRRYQRGRPEQLSLLDSPTPKP